MNNSHRTYRIPSRLRKGWIKSNIDVNWEKMIVFSSPLERSLISFNSRIVSRILADSGGTDPVTATRDFRLALLLSSSQPVQYVASRLDVLVEFKLDNRHYEQWVWCEDPSNGCIRILAHLALAIIRNLHGAEKVCKFVCFFIVIFRFTRFNSVFVVCEIFRDKGRVIASCRWLVNVWFDLPNKRRPSPCRKRSNNTNIDV